MPENTRPTSNHTASSEPTVKKRKRNVTDASAPPKKHPSASTTTPRKQEGGSGSLAQRRARLLPVRQSLPIWSHQDAIRAQLRDERDVLILVGETGSGKSTQVPQFLLQEPWLAGAGGKKKQKLRIAITQPRRVAAISLARRVAEEMGSTLGNASPASVVGYSVRFDVSVAPATRVKYLTEGMLLQELLRDPWLKAYGCVVVDEVHERSVNVDLVLGFLRRIVCGEWREKRGSRLKVVVMSATADTERLVRFFDEGYREASRVETGDAAKEQSVAQPGGQGEQPVARPGGQEEQQSGVESQGQKGKKGKKEKRTKQEQPPAKEADPTPTHHPSISTCYIEGRMYPVQVRYLPEPTTDILESCLIKIFEIHVKEPLPGDVLVFLTGQEAIEALDKLINEYAASMSRELPKIQTLPLFAKLPQHLQQRVFQPAPHFTRKVILSTNIAETSVTVPGVRHVVDSGKSKVKQFRPLLNLESLLVKPISQSAAIQRKGRAGREAPGTCHRLYTEASFASLQKDTTPEILRCDLGAALLMMKARGVRDVLNFPFLDAPPRESLEKALLLLYHLGALTDAGDISDVGRAMAQLPLTPMLSRCLVEAGAESRRCVDDMIDIVAALSTENVFVDASTEERREEVDLARRDLFRREGDHLTLLATVQAYAAEQTDRKAWCERRGINHRAMRNVMDVRKQLTSLCTSLKLLSPSPTNPSTTKSSSSSDETHTTNILQCILAGFALHTARLVPDGSYRTMVGNTTVAIHPSSQLFGRKTEAIVFSEAVFTNRNYARGVSAVRLAWIAEALGATR